MLLLLQCEQYMKYSAYLNAEEGIMRMCRDFNIDIFL